MSLAGGECTCKTDSSRNSSSNFSGFEIWANPVFFLVGVENWRYFLDYIKLRPQEHFFTHDCNVISRNYCIAIVSKICSARAKFADR